MKKLFLFLIALVLNVLALLLVGFIIYHHLSKETHEQAEASPNSEELHLAFVGDLMCHKANYEVAKQADGSYDFRPAFRVVKPYIADADIAFGNLETVFSGTEKGRQYAGYPTFNTPDAYAEALADAGFDHLFMANNHAWDGRSTGLKRTLEVLNDYRLTGIGAYTTPTEKAEVKPFDIKGIKFSVLAYTQHSNGKVPERLRYMLNFIDTAQIRKDIEQQRAKGAELIIVNFHFGEEYKRTPNDYQLEIVRQAINYGADIIVGEHPHVLQPIQLYKTSSEATLDTGVVAFSMGNFYSHQMGTYTNSGIILNIKLKKDKTTGKIQLSHHFAIPTFIAQYQENEQTELLIVHSSLSLQRLLPKRLRKELPTETKLLSEKQYQNMERAFSDAEKLLSASNTQIEIQ